MPLGLYRVVPAVHAWDQHKAVAESGCRCSRKLWPPASAGAKPERFNDHFLTTLIICRTTPSIGTIDGLAGYREANRIFFNEATDKKRY